MDWLTSSVLLNAVVAAALALMVWLAGMVPAIRQRPGLRHGLWLVVLLKFITPPLFPMPFLPMPLLPAWPDASGAPLLRGSEELKLSLQTAAPNESFEDRFDLPIESQSGSSDAGTIPWTATALAISGLGTLAILGFVLWQVRALRRALKHGATDQGRLKKIAGNCAASLLLEKPPSVMILDANISPLLWVGRTGPLIVIPRRLVDLLTQEQLTCVLSHEIAHYQRRDHLTNALSLVVAAVCWWNPVVWWARCELRMTQEVCCDALVLSRTPGGRKTYAQTLFQALEFLQAERPFLPALSSGFGGKSSMERRFEMIANPRVNHRLSWWCLALLFLATAALPMIPAFAPGQEKTVQGEGAADEHAGSSDRITINGVEYQRVPSERKAVKKDAGLPDAALDTLQSDSRIVRLNLRFDESRRAQMKYLELYLSTDFGKTWKLAAANTPDRSQFDHLVPKDGTYWFGLRVTYRNGMTTPAKESDIVPAMKVRVITTESGASGGIEGEGSGFGLGSRTLGEPVEKQGPASGTRSLGEPVEKPKPLSRARNLGEPVEKQGPTSGTRNLGEPVEKQGPASGTRNLGEPVEKQGPASGTRSLGEPVEKPKPLSRARNLGEPVEKPKPLSRTRNLGEPVEKQGPASGTRSLGEPVEKPKPLSRTRNLGEPVEKPKPLSRTRNLGEPVEKQGPSSGTRTLGEPVEKQVPSSGTRTLGEPVEKQGPSSGTRPLGEPVEKPLR